MDEGRPSETAVLCGTQRGLHRLEEARPWILDDPFALPLVGPAWREVHERLRPVVGPRAFVCSRSRYADDRARDGGFAQYVILGAGLDSFAYRHPDLLRAGMRVFEVDHPASQAWKRARAEELALPALPEHAFVPVDFQRDDTQQRLDEAGFDRSQPSVFSWLGVSMYLTEPAIEAVLKSVAKLPAGSEIVFTYWPHADTLSEQDAARRAGVAERAAASGEPILTTPHPKEAEELVTRCGLEVVDHPDGAALTERYAAGRADGLQVSSSERIILARVPGTVSP